MAIVGTTRRLTSFPCPVSETLHGGLVGFQDERPIPISCDHVCKTTPLGLELSFTNGFGVQSCMPTFKVQRARTTNHKSQVGNFCHESAPWHVLNTVKPLGAAPAQPPMFSSWRPVHAGSFGSPGDPKEPLSRPVFPCRVACRVRRSPSTEIAARSQRVNPASTSKALSPETAFAPRVKELAPLGQALGEKGRVSGHWHKQRHQSAVRN